MGRGLPVTLHAARGRPQGISRRVRLPGSNPLAVDVRRSRQHKPTVVVSSAKESMATRRSRAAQSLATQAAELAFAVPQVVAHRVTRMALSGPKPSPRDRKEFERMVAEKNIAFGESWKAMTTQAALANQALAASFFRSLLSVARGKKPSARATTSQFHKAALGVLGKDLAPVHRKAVANAKRLSRTKLR